MRDAESLAGLAEELGALSGRQRRAVLKELSPFERAQAIALIEANVADRASKPDYSPFSPWLARHLAEGRSDERGLTPASRELLAETAAAIVDTAGPAAAASVVRRPRSLAGVVADALSRRRARR